ncbi:MAG: hypothetical protein V3U92_10875 [Cellulophaga sp.]
MNKNQISECKELKNKLGSGISATTVSTYFTKQILVRYDENGGFKTTYGSGYVRFGLKKITSQLFINSAIKGQKGNLNKISDCINEFLGYFNIEYGEDFEKIECLDNQSLKNHLSTDACPEETLNKLRLEYSKHVAKFLNKSK